MNGRPRRTVVQYHAKVRTQTHRHRHSHTQTQHTHSTHTRGKQSPLKCCTSCIQSCNSRVRVPRGFPVFVRNLKHCDRVTSGETTRTLYRREHEMKISSPPPPLPRGCARGYCCCRLRLQSARRQLHHRQLGRPAQQLHALGLAHAEQVRLPARCVGPQRSERVVLQHVGDRASCNERQLGLRLER